MQMIVGGQMEWSSDCNYLLEIVDSIVQTKVRERFKRIVQLDLQLSPINRCIMFKM